MTDRPPPVVRPNGKLYRPRVVKAHAWEDDSWPGHERQGVVIIGTHDLERAQAFADKMVKYWFDDELVATDPMTGWWRCSYISGELCWNDNPERGGAGIYFTADYPEDV